MNRKLSVLAIAVGAACAAPAFAEVVEVYTIPTGRDVYYAPSTADTYYVAPQVTTDTYYVAPRTYYYTEPATTYYYVEPAITVEAPRYYNDDQRITNDVADMIAGDSRINGNVGVQTYRNQVTLSGRVTTPGMRDRAGVDARSVDGVDEVQNLIKPRVGDYF